MTAVVFYFQCHQPFRLRRFRHTDIGKKVTGSLDEHYFDEGLNRLVLERVAERCYLPMNAVIAEAIEATEGAFRCSFALTGTLLDQLERWAPAALDSFVSLSRTGSVEFVCETQCHSLASQADPLEFVQQVEHQRARLKELFGLAPTTFRNTELILDEDVARRVEDLGFRAMVGEGVDRLLEWRSPRRVYGVKGCESLRLLLRDYPFSDDIAFRFSNRKWEEYPLMADRFATWLQRATADDA